MAIIKWDDGFSVNVAKIDQQHQKLILMNNELNEAMGQGKGKDVLGRIVNGLISYTATHFKTEEDYFKQLGYPEAGSHIKEHIAFVEKVTEFKEGFENGKLSLSIEVMTFLSNWLRNHIKVTDKKYSRFFNQKGLK
ncbi:MAG: hemerythrin [Desulfobacterales bacterium RIFOXYA12_FULL_46_15]|nr:MAG: hemerythrin [Desulfobacula sp. GWF2_41_7]OGR22653.1 MAG: hemerythrin [Desulfobacterales bacterium RIFOXYA12_FULL_46_15]